jgi:hypothetical protein
MGIQPRNTDRFFTRHQPPAGPAPFHEQVDRMQQVIQAHAPGAQAPAVQGRGNAQVQGTTDLHTQPGMGNHPGDQTPKAGDKGDFRGFGGDKSSGAGGNNGGDRAGKPEAPQQNNSGGTAKASQTPETHTPDNRATDNRDRGGWTKFGGGRQQGDSGRTDQSNPATRDNTRVPRTDKGSSSGVSNSGQGAASGDDHGGFRKFPGGGDRVPQQPDRAEQPKSTTPGGATGDHGGWQKFPSNSGPGSRQSDPGNTNRDRSGPSQNKPPLELNKPIVTPRNTPSPMPSRMPEIHNEPRSMPSPSRMPETHGGSRTEPSHSERSSGGGGGGGSRGGDRGGNHGGGGDKGSKSSSGPKFR